MSYDTSCVICSLLLSNKNVRNAKTGQLECQQKWEHILQYQSVGIADGHTVAKFLDSITLL